MARIFDTAYLTEAAMKAMGADDLSNIYNGLDCCLTLEIFGVLQAELAESPSNVAETYALSMEKSGPVLDMCMRGILIDLESRERVHTDFQQKLNLLQHNFDYLCEGVFGCTFNYASPKQLKELFYDILGCKPIRKRNARGEWSVTTDEDALTKLREHVTAGIFANYILEMRSLKKKIEVLVTPLDSDNRMRTSINIAGTNTGRLASSTSDFGTGRNQQNIEDAMRRPFIPDPGRAFVNVDLEQADARNVGIIVRELFREKYGIAAASKYLDYCESGDLHTNVSKLVFTELPWTDDPKENRKIADQPYYRHFSYRDITKRLGHGTNYYGQPHTMAKHTHIEQRVIEKFQQRYFAEFPLLREWHEYVQRTLIEAGQLTTLYGRRRHFWSRPEQASTLREAIAYEPQSMTGHEIDMGMIQLWWKYPEYWLHIQVHDSLLISVPDDGNLAHHVENILEEMKFIFTTSDEREFTVPLEAAAGWNWGKFDEEENPHGLKKWRGQDERIRPDYRHLSVLG